MIIAIHTQHIPNYQQRSTLSANSLLSFHDVT